MTTRARTAVATQGFAAEAAATVLARGNAMDAVAAGVFAAAAMHPSVLLGPVQILLGGAGAGLRAIDGRTRQPGIDQQRPRGFITDDEIPPAARVATPALAAALAAALATAAGGSLARAIGPGHETAKRVAPARAAVLQRLARRGASALTEEPIIGELTAAAGRVSGGLLSAADIDAVLPAVVACATTSVGERGVATVPWGAEAVRDESAAPLSASRAEVVAACDGRGLVAIACYEVWDDGLPIEELGLVAPPLAAPVRRGQTRVKPGDPRPAAAPIALSQAAGLVDLALGIGRSERAEIDVGAALRAIAGGAVVDEAMSNAVAAGGELAAIARTRDVARALHFKR